MPGEPNVTYLDDPSSVLGVIASQSQSRRPTVLHFFGQGCPGCKALHPKLKQVVRNNPDFTFHKVNVTSKEMMECALAWKVTSLPYFVVFYDGSLSAEFTCNLATIDRLRSMLANARTGVKPGLVHA